MGKTFSVSDEIFHSAVKYGIALLGRALPIVELMTVVIVVQSMKLFLAYTSSVSRRPITSCSAQRHKS